MANNDYQKMASAFMDMWQEKLAESFSDKNIVHNMMDAMQQMQTHAPRGQYEGNRNTTYAPSAYDDELADLSERLADCEQRIYELELEVSALRKAKKAKTEAVPQASSRAKRSTGTRKPATSGSATGSKSKAKKTVKRPTTRKRTSKNS